MITTFNTYAEPTRNAIIALVIGLALGVMTFISPLIALGAVVAFVALLVLAERPMILCYMTILGIAIFSGMPRNSILPLLIPNEPILGASFGMGLFVVLGRRYGKVVPPRLTVAIIILALGTAVFPALSYQARGRGLGISEIMSLFAPLQYIFLFWIYAYLPRTEDERRRVIHVMLIGASIVAVVGLLQAANFGPVMNILNTYYPSDQTDQAADLGRVTSLMNAWNALGTYMMLNVILIMSLLGNKFSRLGLFNLYFSLGACMACLLASGSYASLGVLPIGIAIVKFYNRKGMKTLLYLALGVVVAVFALQSIILERLEYQFRSSRTSGVVPETLSYRFYVWGNIYLPIIAKNPLFGIEPTFENVTWGWAESQYFYLMFRSGVVSLIAHLTWVFLCITWLYKRLRQSTDVTRAVATTCMVMFILLSFMGITNEVFTLSGVTDYVWIMLGLVANAGEVIEREREKRFDGYRLGA